MSDELLPNCPFCGSPAKKAKGSYFDKGVYCQNIKGCRIGGIIFHSEEAWNTRPDSKPYKYENSEQVMQNVDSYSLGFHHGFNAARERKE